MYAMCYLLLDVHLGLRYCHLGLISNAPSDFENNLLCADLILTAGDVDIARGRDAHARQKVDLRMHERVFASRAESVCWVQRRWRACSLGLPV